MPTLSAYRKNTVSLDTATLGENVDIEQSGLTLIPTSGAVVLPITQPTLVMRSVSLRYHGEPLPFGAQAEVVEQNRHSANRSMVADGGQAYLSGVPERGTLRVTGMKTGSSSNARHLSDWGKLIWPRYRYAVLECH
ncbi:MAG: FimD/PapC C-terminal domain-containing protein [Escherichia coli]